MSNALSPVAPRNETAALERVGPDDQLLNFMQWYYSALTDPRGKLRTSNLLFRSFEWFACDRRYHDLVAELRERVGLHQTIWGLKKAGDRYVWEYYFYRNFDRERMSVRHVMPVFANYFSVDLGEFDEELPYEAFSVDLDGTCGGEIKAVNVYYTNPQHIWVFKVGSSGREFENDYDYYPYPNRRKAAARLFLSPFAGAAMNPAEIFMPELEPCDSLFVATKRNAGGVYHQGLNVRQLLFFLERFGYHAPLVDFVREHERELDYVQFDTGFDFNFRGGALHIKKSGFYGTF